MPSDLSRLSHRVEHCGDWVQGIADMIRAATMVGLGVTLLLVAEMPARADLVYGRITQGDQPYANSDCTFVRGEGSGAETTVHTDGDGRYSAFLDPGVYVVRCGSRTGQARSHAQPLRQDINLQ